MGRVMFDAFKYLIPFCLGAMVVVLLMDMHEGAVIDYHGVAARGFYYGVIVFALYYITNKRKRMQQDAAEAHAAAKAPAELPKDDAGSEKHEG